MDAIETQTQATKERLLRLRDVKQRIGFGTSSIYCWMNAGVFPRPVRIGASVRWRETEINAWLEQLIAETRPAVEMPGDADTHSDAEAAVEKKTIAAHATGKKRAGRRPAKREAQQPA